MLLRDEFVPFLRALRNNEAPFLENKSSRNHRLGHDLPRLGQGSEVRNPGHPIRTTFSTDA
jgi:hypothetical protein